MTRKSNPRSPTSPATSEKKPAGVKPEAPQQQQGGTGQQYGEGNYAATRQYNEGVADHMKHHDIEREARDAEPRDAGEAREMEDAERAGRSKARGESEERPDKAKDGGKR
jgi:hypothetical protein